MGKGIPTIDSILSRLAKPSTTKKVIDATTPFNDIEDQNVWMASCNNAMERYVHPSLSVYTEHAEWPVTILNEIRYNKTGVPSLDVQCNLERRVNEWYWSVAQKTIFFQPLVEALASAPPAARTAKNLRVYYLTAITKELWSRALKAPLSQRVNQKDWPRYEGLVSIVQAEEYTSINLTTYGYPISILPPGTLYQLNENCKGNTMYFEASTLTKHGPINIWFDYTLDIPTYNYNGQLLSCQETNIISMAPRHIVERHVKELRYPTDRKLPVYADSSNAMLGNISRFGDNTVPDEMLDLKHGTPLYPISYTYTDRKAIPEDTVIIRMRIVKVKPPKEKKKPSDFIRSFTNEINYYKAPKG